MSNVFKPGDLIFLIDRIGYVRLVKYVTNYGSKTVETIDTETDNDYLGYGFAATPENREALVTLYGEDAVPELPVRGSELTKKLLEKQRYVLCFCSDTNDDDCREIKRPLLITSFEDGYFYEGKADITFVTTWKCAVPVDMNGNEITEIE